MERRKLLDIFISLGVVLGSFFLMVTTVYGNSVTSTVVVGTAAPSISSLFIDGNNPSTITLTTNATTAINVEATISDNNGCSEITGGTTTILLYRSGVGSSSCSTSANNSNCYQATAFTASSTCSGGVVNTTTTFGVYYFAQATDASSSFPNQNWVATLSFTTVDKTTSTADTTYSTSSNDILSLIALNVTTTINYGTLSASSTSGSTDQVTTTTNAGNTSTTLQLSAASTLTNGSNSISTSSQGYSTSTFTYPGTSTALSAVAATVQGFLLTSPTSTTNVQQLIYWGLQVPAGTATGTYNGTTLYTAVFHT